MRAIGWVAGWFLVFLVAPVWADVVVAESEIHRSVTDFVEELVSDFEGEVSVSVRWRGDVQVEGTGAVRVTVRQSTGRSSARMVPVTLEIRRGPVVVREYPISAQVDYFDRVLAAAQRIPRGAPIAEDMVRAERREVTTMLGRYVKHPAELKGMRARMQIGFGRLIDPRYLEPIPAVERGEQVQIRVRVGTVQASTVGVATESGVIGERIMVENAASGERLLAEVVEPGVVEAVF